MFRVQSSRVRYKTFHSSSAEQSLFSVLQPKRWGMDRAPGMFLWTIKILRGLCFMCGSTRPRAQPLLLLFCSLLLCIWFWSFSFRKNMQNEWAEEGVKRESQSNRLLLLRLGAGGVNPVCVFPSPLLCPTLCSAHTTGRCAQLCLTPTY